MNTYETTFIISPETPQEKIDTLIEKIKKFISDRNGQLILLENEGVKKLAYEIKKQKEGNYIFIEYTASGEVVKEIENLFKLNESVLRYLTVVKKAPCKQKIKKTKKSKKVQEVSQEKPSSDIPVT